MRKWYIAGAVLFILCAAITIALLNLNRLIQQNRAFVIAQAEQVLGRKITAGEIDLAILGGIGVQIKDFALADDPAFSSGDFLRAKRLQINLRLWPLLRRKFEIKHVILREPVIHISRNAAGEFNVSSLGRKEKPREPKPDQTRQRREQPSAAPPVPIFFANIADGEVIYQDRKDGTELDVKQVDLTVKQSGSDRAFVQLEAALFSAERNVKVETNVGPLRGADIRHTRLDGTADIDPLDTKALQNAVPKLNSLLPKELRVSGSLALRKAKFNGTPENLTLKGTVEGTGAAIDFGKNFTKRSSVPLELVADAQYANDTIYVRNADLRLHNAAIHSRGEIHLGDGTAVNLALDTRPFSLAGWGSIIPPAAQYELSGTAEVHAMVRGPIGRGGVPEVQGTVNLSGSSVKPPHWPTPIKNLNSRINFSGQKAEMKKGTFQLGNSNVRFDATVERFSPFTLSYTVSTRELRPADFQSSISEERKGDVFKNVSSTGRLSLPAGRLTLEAKLESSDGILRKIAFEHLDATVAIADKTARLHSVRMDTLGGQVAGSGEYAFGESVPRFSMDAKIQKVDIDQFYRALNPRTQRDVQGRLNATATVAGSGKQWEEIKPTLSGQGDAEILDGALLNVNLADAALSATGIPGIGNIVTPEMRRKYPETFEAKDTRFKQAKAHFDIADGRSNVSDLRVTAPDYSIQGDGWVNFDRRINFHTQLVLSAPLSADLAKSMREAKLLFNSSNQFTMPFTVSGRLPRVKAKPDSSYLVKMFQRGSARQLSEELEQKYLGGSQPNAPRDGDANDLEPTQKRKKKPSTEELIRKGLEGLFRR